MSMDPVATVDADVSSLVEEQAGGEMVWLLLASWCSVY